MTTSLRYERRLTESPGVPYKSSLWTDKGGTQGWPGQQLIYETCSAGRLARESKHLLVLLWGVLQGGHGPCCLFTMV